MCIYLIKIIIWVETGEKKNCIHTEGHVKDNLRLSIFTYF